VHIISYVGDKLIVMPGRRFGRLKVVREGPGQPVKGKTYRRRTMICRCRCGSPDKEILLWLLTPGGTLWGSIIGSGLVRLLGWDYR
jgi:hypothetical protein